jgi:Flp pilus assembly protein TadB
MSEEGLARSSLPWMQSFAMVFEMNCLHKDKMRRSIRHGNIGIAAGAMVLLAGVLAFGHSNEAALQATALIGMFGGLALAVGLQERARRGRKGPQ